MIKLALSVLLFASAGRADFQPVDWQFRRSLKLEAVAPVARARMDAIVYRGSGARLADLRVVRDGVESPYLIDTSGAPSDTRDTFATFDKLSPVQDGKTQSTVFAIDLGFAGLPHDQIQLQVGPGLFNRAVRIETSADGKDWSYAGQGTVYRTTGQQELSLVFSELWDRHLRLRIMNRDDLPLDVRRISVNTIARYIEYPAERAGRYWLYYGNPEAKQPAYDLGLVLADRPAVAEARLGPPEANPDYRPRPIAEKPWTDRHPGLLYSVLGLAILAMSYVTLRFLRKVSARV